MFNIDCREGMNGIPRGMKCYPIQFSSCPYNEHLQISHLFDTMHIGKNVREMIWRILDGRTDKDKIGKICSDIAEANHALQSVINSNVGEEYRNVISIPWLLKEQPSNDIKEVIQKIRFPTRFSSNIKNILMKNGDFGGVKTHDWHTFIKVIIYLYNFHLVHIFSNCGLLFGI